MGTRKLMDLKSKATLQGGNERAARRPRLCAGFRSFRLGRSRYRRKFAFIDAQIAGQDNATDVRMNRGMREGDGGMFLHRWRSCQKCWKGSWKHRPLIWKHFIT